MHTSLIAMDDPAELSNKMPLLSKDAPAAAAVVAVAKRIVLDSPIMVDPDMVTLPLSASNTRLGGEYLEHLQHVLSIC